MKANLIKTDDEYRLYLDDVLPYATSDNSPYKRLSKQNCDEIFGVVDAGKLAEEEIPYSSSTTINVQRMRFIHGFNKAMELNKDKLFTIEDMRTAMLNAIEMTDFQKEQFRKDNDYHIALDIIQSLQQPIEIDVTIEHYNFELPGKPIGRRVFKPKLDSEGCIILKRVV